MKRKEKEKILETLAKSYVKLQELYNKAMKEGDLETLQSLAVALREVERTILRSLPSAPYRVFISRCMAEEMEKGKKKSLAEVQVALAKCAKKWSSLSEEEKKKITEEILSELPKEIHEKAKKALEALEKL